MSLTFTVDEVLTALYGGILGRKPDATGHATATQTLEEDPTFLEQLVANLLSSPERFDAERFQPQILRGLYRAALGREPDTAGIESYAKLLQHDFAKGIVRIADSLHFSAEYQDRLIPEEFDRLFVDHSPNGELMPLLRHLAARSAGVPVIVEIGIDDAAATVSLDLLRLLGWQGVLIESAPERHAAIESRYSGLNFRLRHDAVLARDKTVDPDRDETRQVERLRDMMDTATPKDALVSLTHALSKAGVPARFDILAIGAGSNLVDVVNDFVSEQVFAPAVMVLAIEVPADCVTLQQLGLNAGVAERYQVIATSPRSVTLSRIEGAMPNGSIAVDGSQALPSSG